MNNENCVIKTNKNNFVDFYDIIVHIDSIKDINKGWKIEMNQIGEQNYQNHKSEKVIKIGVIGNANKGKSFILSKLSKMVLPSGMSIKTEGLSIKYPYTTQFKNRRIVLLDSAELETPVLKSDEILNDINSNVFKEKSRDKFMTESFLQNYIINNSDILIIVVGILTYSDNKLLRKIKKELDKAKLTTPLFIIHNLYPFTNVKQVENYIDNSLLKSATFTLEQGKVISTKVFAHTGIYFYETDKKRKIYHLIYANENSEAGIYYNQFTLNFIENSYQTVTELGSFDVIDSIKERFISFSKDTIDNIEDITKESFDDSIPNMIKLKGENKIILKKCLIDELGFSKLITNSFEPPYNIYKKDHYIFVKLEIPGNCMINSTIALSGEYNVIEISGEKKLDKEKVDKNIGNTRLYGKFNLKFELKLEEYPLICDAPEIKNEKGIYILKYKLAQ